MKRLLLLLLSISPLAFIVVACSSSSSGGGTTQNNGTDAGGTQSDAASPATDSGAPSEGGVPSDSGASGCTWTVTGSSMASGTCTMQAALAPADMKIGVTLTSPGSILTFAAPIDNQTTFKTGTYTLTQAPTAGATFHPDTTSLWAMCNNNACTDGKGNMVPNQGTFTLTVTDTGPDTTNFWAAPHGTLTIDMPADPNTTASGAVTATVTF
jgi:hypothetical protein